MNIDMAAVNKMIDAGFISKRKHSDDSDIVILNYTPECVFERAWNEQTLQCRGLIVNERTGEVLARGFNKFFNYGEETGLEEAYRPGKPEITVKHDGSLGILYRVNGEVRWSTRGDFESSQSKVANRIWKKKYSHAKVPNNLTLLAEIISPETRVVVDYDGLEELILIGVIDRFNGQDYSYEEMKLIGETIGMPVTEKVPGTLSGILKVAKTLDHNHEGFVLRWENGYRLKVKGDKYVEVHKLVYGLSDKQLASSWASGSLRDYLVAVPEEFRKDVEKKVEKLEQTYENIISEVDDAYKKIPKYNVRRNFAWEVENNVQATSIIKNCIFMKYDRDEESLNRAVRSYIQSNYLNYI